MSAVEPAVRERSDLVVMIDSYSVSTVPLEMLFNQTNLSQGTGFIWKVGNDFFLITNWHNLSGKNPFTGKHLSATLAEPNAVRVWWNVRDKLGHKAGIEHSIRDNDGHPLWYIHPVHGRKIDVWRCQYHPQNRWNLTPSTQWKTLTCRSKSAWMCSCLATRLA
ncbi:hypothetical protein EN844_19370 [Mesorhizobium sp. M3A.F.Ca.ET.201.01.1.1]|uniref:hypothetical protein n=1 Tax=Mesorhizobium sp. M3A.F.Ca.ET.201.01.1.1 TaxID=2563946 RepID=UPI001093A991|nr:hypothetical protein [Mesorhizobium sp. M3A.F.Ca.ET.201.01.1.1]TGS65556.1 hypothetical protein EN844_19370 [Mesorhizobium sp. M3A.F.Ca.ET.201.01.1.1]